jgi:hypothetical protein
MTDNVSRANRTDNFEKLEGTTVSSIMPRAAHNLFHSVTHLKAFIYLFCIK